MGGGPAAGKTTTMQDPEAGVPQGKAAVVVAADEIKDHLPEFAEEIAAGNSAAGTVVHEESTMIAKRLQREAQRRGLDVILDGTADHSKEKMLEKIEAARAAGYKVNAVYVTVDLDEAVARSIRRGDETGRYVPEFYLRSAHQSVAQIVPEIADQFDSIKVYETGPQTPILLMRGEGGQIEIVDESGYAAFIERGK